MKKRKRLQILKRRWEWFFVKQQKEENKTLYKQETTRIVKEIRSDTPDRIYYKYKYVFMFGIRAFACVHLQVLLYEKEKKGGEGTNLKKKKRKEDEERNESSKENRWGGKAKWTKINNVFPSSSSCSILNVYDVDSHIDRCARTFYKCARSNNKSFFSPFLLLPPSSLLSTNTSLPRTYTKSNQEKTKHCFSTEKNGRQK